MAGFVSAILDIVRPVVLSSICDAGYDLKTLVSVLFQGSFPEVLNRFYRRALYSCELFGFDFMAF